MGNTSTKEQRPLSPTARYNLPRSVSSPQVPRSTSPSDSQPAEAPSQVIYSSRHGRGSRSELSSLLGIGANIDRHADGPEGGRRETKQEREARKLGKERIARERERERSMRDESVDGGYLVTQGVYTGIEDYNKAVVRLLMIERRIAPFWRGLNDHSSSWTENQLVAAARALPIPAPDEIPPDEPQRPFSTSGTNPRASKSNVTSLTVPISSRSLSYNSDSSSNLSPIQLNFSLPSPSTAASTLLRGRAKTLATLTTSSKNMPQPELMPREMHLPKDPYVNGQHIEAYLYKDASECPICFLYYPPYLNKTRCCDQAICSECFVQIKRPDPHPPEHADPTAPISPVVKSSSSAEVDLEGSLVSEPAACPFCVQPEFGVTYDPPPFRRGLTYVNQSSGHPLANATSAMSSSSSLASFSATGGQTSPTTMTRRRTTSVSANSPAVITTDRVRPDWASKLSTARAHAARRSAAATALHTAAYLMGNRNGSPDSRGFGALGRRGLLRRGTSGNSPSAGASSTHLSMLTLMSERYGQPAGARGDSGTYDEASPTIVGSQRDSSRRNRVDDLEEMMVMEAIRLSLASEEGRRRREDKDAKKEAKKKSKEDKKAEKAARKAGIYPTSTNQSTATLERQQSADLLPGNGKGKGLPPQQDYAGPSEPGLQPASFSRPALGNSLNDNAQIHLERSRAQINSDGGSSSPYASSNYKPSHLRNLSNVSSSASSVADSTGGTYNVGESHSSFEPSPSASGINIPRAGLHETFRTATPPGGGAGTEPMFNFRSLAAMIGNDEKAEPRSLHSGQAQYKHDNPDHSETRDGVEYSPSSGALGETTQSSTKWTSPSRDTPSGSHTNDGSQLEHDETVQTQVVPPGDNEDEGASSTGSKGQEIQVMNHENTCHETGSV
ncbi:SNF1-interacting protein [Lambiella insularis]|nr:SNF1-interacting protein [Lambiella insularis]